MTASTPTRVSSPSYRNIVGTPPPPARSSRRRARAASGSGDLEDVPWLRRPHHPAQLAVGLEHQPLAASGRRPPVSVRSGRRLGRIVERRVARVDLHHGQDRRQRRIGSITLPPARGRSRSSPSVCAPKMSSGYTSTWCTPRPAGEKADLRPLPSRALAYSSATAASAGDGDPHVDPLVLPRHRLPALRECMPPRPPRRASTSPSSGQSPRVATMTALMVCRRFSAWSNDDRVLGLEDVVGHLEAIHAELLEVLPTFVSRLWKAGRQCMNFARGYRCAAARLLVHLIRRQELDPLLPDALVLAHRDPHVGVQVGRRRRRPRRRPR